MQVPLYVNNRGTLTKVLTMYTKLLYCHTEMYTQTCFHNVNQVQIVQNICNKKTRCVFTREK